MRIAPACLSLPLIQVPAQFSVVKKPTAELTAAALALVEGGWLTPAMYQAHQGNLAACIADSISTVAKAARPRPLANLSALVADSGEHAEVGDGVDEYNRLYKQSAGEVGALVVSNPTEKPIHRLIGPGIMALEKVRAGLGATTLYWLSSALNKTTGACDPITGLGWAQGNYWSGETDETMALEDRLEEERSYYQEQQENLPAAERQPFDEDEAIKHIDLFTREKYDEKIPRWVSDLRRPALTNEQLSRIRLPARSKTLAEVFSGTPDFIPALINVAELAAAAPHGYQTHDGGCFESIRWEICPFLLRWQRGEADPAKANGDWVQDHLGMIWDDYMNNEYQNGEANMHAVAAWAWHDGPSLIAAMHRFDRWCRLLQAAETLLNHIQPQNLITD